MHNENAWWLAAFVVIALVVAGFVLATKNTTDSATNTPQTSATQTVEFYPTEDPKVWVAPSLGEQGKGGRP